jgi:hypothetical protein
MKYLSRLFMLLYIICALCACSRSRHGAITTRFVFCPLDSAEAESERYRKDFFDSVEIWTDASFKNQLIRWKAGQRRWELVMREQSQVLHMTMENRREFYGPDQVDSVLAQHHIPTFRFNTQAGSELIQNRMYPKSISPGDSLFSYGEACYDPRFENHLPMFKGLGGLPMSISFGYCGSDICLRRDTMIKDASIHWPLDFNGSIPGVPGSMVTAVVGPIHMYGLMKEYFKGQPLELVPVEITVDGGYPQRYTTSCSGKFDFHFFENHIYFIRFGGESFVNKIVMLDTHGATYEGGFDISIDGTLFSPEAEQDFSFLLEPVAIISYADSVDAFEFNQEYSEKMANRIKAEMAKRKNK